MLKEFSAAKFFDEAMQKIDEKHPSKPQKSFNLQSIKYALVTAKPAELNAKRIFLNESHDDGFLSEIQQDIRTLIGPLVPKDMNADPEKFLREFPTQMKAAFMALDAIRLQEPSQGLAAHKLLGEAKMSARSFLKDLCVQLCEAKPELTLPLGDALESIDVSLARDSRRK